MTHRFALVCAYVSLGVAACSGGDERPGFGGSGSGGASVGAGGGSSAGGRTGTGGRTPGSGGEGVGDGGPGTGGGGPAGGAGNSGGAGSSGGGNPGGGSGTGGAGGPGSGGNGPGTGGGGNVGAGGTAAGGGNNGGSGGRAPQCTLTTPSTFCDGCILLSCNSQCLTCEGNAGCVAILECAKTDCFANGKIDAQCALECMQANPSGSGVFQQLINPQGCVMSACGAMCNFF